MPDERRELWELIVDLITVMGTQDVTEYGLQIRDIDVDLPVEVQTIETQLGFRILVDLPRWRWEAGLRPHIGRIHVRLAEVQP